MYKVLKTCRFAFEPWEKQLSLTKDEVIDLPETKAALLLQHGVIEIIKEEVIEAENKMLEPDEDKSIKLTYKKNKKNKRIKK